MSASSQLQIRAAVAALFNATAALAGGNVFENRAFNLASGVDAQLHVNLEQSVPERVNMGPDAPIDWTTTIELRILTRKASSVEAADAADALWTQAFARLMANPTLGGLVQDLEAGEMDVDVDEADTSVCRLAWRFTVQHRTTNNSLS